MKKLGLVLGGGAVRGLAHIGVLKSLEKHDIPIACIIGTSMGGVVGGLFAAGISAREIEAMFTQTPKYRFIDLSFWQRGLLSGNWINKVIEDLLEEKGIANLVIEQFPIRFKAIAVDLIEGKQITMDQGDLKIALRATSAFPGVFAPLMKDGQMLVDGGVLNNLPIADMLQEPVDVIVAVDVSRQLERKPPRNMIEVIYRSYSLMTSERKQSSLHLADLVVRPDVGQYPAFDFTKSVECISAGEEAMNALMPTLLKLLTTQG